MTWTEPTRQAYVREVLRDRPAGFWPLWDNGAQATDQSGNNNPGTYTGGYALGQAGPAAGIRATAFDGSSGLVDCGNKSAFSFNNTDAFTISIWFRSTGGSGSQVLVSKITSDNNGYKLEMSNTVSGQLRLRLWLDGTSFPSNDIAVYGNSNILSSTWRMATATYNGNALASGCQLYINGASESPTVQFNALSGSISSTQPLRFGQRGDGADKFSGNLCCAALFNYALSPSRIAAHYNVMTGRQKIRRTYSIPSGSLRRLRLLTRAA